jgi:hypothetical protein
MYIQFGTADMQGGNGFDCIAVGILAAQGIVMSRLNASSLGNFP